MAGCQGRGGKPEPRRSDSVGSHRGCPWIPPDCSHRHEGDAGRRRSTRSSSRSAGRRPRASRPTMCAHLPARRGISTRVGDFRQGSKFVENSALIYCLAFHQVISTMAAMNTQDLLKLPAVKWKRILALKTEIERLQSRLETVIITALPGPLQKVAKKKRHMSAAARKKISIAAKARWAKIRAAKAK